MVAPRKSGSGELLKYLILLMKFFSQKIQHKVLGLEIQLILSIVWLWHLKISVKSKKKNGQNVYKTTLKMESCEFEMSYDQN